MRTVAGILLTATLALVVASAFHAGAIGLTVRGGALQTFIIPVDGPGIPAAEVPVVGEKVPCGAEPGDAKHLCIAGEARDLWVIPDGSGESVPEGGAVVPDTTPVSIPSPTPAPAFVQNPTPFPTQTLIPTPTASPTPALPAGPSGTGVDGRQGDDAVPDPMIRVPIVALP
jgi:hypothetical protein